MTLYGLENISAHNGWAISLVGVSIVFIGLTLLSLSISQLHKILDIWETKEKYTNNRDRTTLPLTEVKTKPLRSMSANELETIRQYKMIVDRIGHPFSLPKLLYLAKKIGLERPHSTINSLLVKKIIVSDGKGYFIWKL